MTENVSPTPWGLIVGSSSGFGAAVSLELARSGLNILGVHFDRRQNMPQVEQVIARIRETGRDVLFFNINAADPGKRTEALNQMQEHWKKAGGEHFVKVLLHSVAFGSLKPYVGESPEDELTQQQMDMTVDVMGNNLVYWVQELFRRKMLGPRKPHLLYDQRRRAQRDPELWRGFSRQGGHGIAHSPACV